MNVVFQDAFLGKGPGANMHFCVGFLGSPLNWCPSALKRLEAIILFKNRAQMCNKAYTECVYPLVHFLRKIDIALNFSLSLWFLPADAIISANCLASRDRETTAKS